MATSSVKIASKNHISGKLRHCLLFFFVKKHKTIQRKKRSKGRGCMRIKIDAMTGVELRAPG